MQRCPVDHLLQLHVPCPSAAAARALPISCSPTPPTHAIRRIPSVHPSIRSIIFPTPTQTHALTPNAPPAALELHVVQQLLLPDDLLVELANPACQVLVLALPTADLADELALTGAQLVQPLAAAELLLLERLVQLPRRRQRRLRLAPHHLQLRDLHVQAVECRELGLQAVLEQRVALACGVEALPLCVEVGLGIGALCGRLRQLRGRLGQRVLDGLDLKAPRREQVGGIRSQGWNQVAGLESGRRVGIRSQGWNQAESGRRVGGGEHVKGGRGDEAAPSLDSVFLMASACNPISLAPAKQAAS
eukprot:355822-Chlamydomonas_euryale.AAC.1